MSGGLLRCAGKVHMLQDCMHARAGVRDKPGCIYGPQLSHHENDHGQTRDYVWIWPESTLALFSVLVHGSLVYRLGHGLGHSAAQPPFSIQAS